MGKSPLGRAVDSNRLQGLLDHWGEIWETPELADHVRVEFSARLEGSLGRCRPSTGRISLAEQLKTGARLLLHEVLCHEAAHVATYLRFGASARPHGPEWQTLVQAAGFEPRLRVADQRMGNAASTAVQGCSRRAPVQYEHRCPVCQAVRYARRKVPSWGCTACAELGLSGRLVISRVEADAPSGDSDE